MIFDIEITGLRTENGIVKDPLTLFSTILPHLPNMQQRHLGSVTLMQLCCSPPAMRCFNQQGFFSWRLHVKGTCVFFCPSISNYTAGYGNVGYISHKMIDTTWLNYLIYHNVIWEIKLFSVTSAWECDNNITIQYILCIVDWIWVDVNSILRANWTSNASHVTLILIHLLIFTFK